MNNETMNNETRKTVKRRVAILMLTGYWLLLAVFPAVAQEADPLATAVLLPGAVGWLMVLLAIVLMVGLARWMRQR
jgi:hypothetical protein